jgi:hypothetical protein
MGTADEFPEYLDEFGEIGPLPASHGQRIPPEEGFFTGPEIGSAFPRFNLRSSAGGTLNPQKDRGGSKAAVVFFRSAVW